MKKVIIVVIVVVFHFSWAFTQMAPKVSNKDFKSLSGEWKGKLTYLDYSSNKPFTMPAEININRIGKSNMYLLAHKYPNEPKANSYDTMIISTDGRKIDEETIISKRTLDHNTIEIETQKPGKDGNDNKPALIKHTYSIGKLNYKTTKEVQFVGETKWIKRNEFSYVRK